MTDWFRRNQTFCFALLGGGVLFLVAFHFILSMFAQSHEIYVQLSQKEDSIRRLLDRLQEEGGLVYQKELTPILKNKILPRLSEELVYTPPKEYLWKKGDNPAFYFSTKKSALVQKLSLLADRKGISFGGLSISSEKIQEDNIQEYLLRLSLAELIVLEAMDVGFSRILSVEGENPIVSHPIPNTRYELRWIPLQVVLEGSQQNCIDLLRRFSRKTTPQKWPPVLELLECTLQPATGGQEAISVHLTFGALQIIKTQKAHKPKSSRPSGRHKNPWDQSGWGGFRRIR